MLVKFTATQIGKAWDTIKFTLEQALPPFTFGDPERYNNIYQELLTDKMQCWVGQLPQANAPPVVYGIVTTTVSEDACSGVKNLLIYSLYGFQQIPQELWLASYETLRKYALSKGCHRIVGYSNSNAILEVVDRFGADSKYHFISIEI